MTHTVKDVILTTFSTPSGSPASFAKTHNAKADKGVSSAGLIVTVHPAAKAGPSFLVIIADGKFQGVTKAAGPTGCTHPSYIDSITHQHNSNDKNISLLSDLLNSHHALARHGGRNGIT